MYALKNLVRINKKYIFKILNSANIYIFISKKVISVHKNKNTIPPMCSWSERAHPSTIHRHLTTVEYSIHRRPRPSRWWRCRRSRCSSPGGTRAPVWGAQTPPSWAPPPGSSSTRLWRAADTIPGPLDIIIMCMLLTRPFLLMVSFWIFEIGWGGEVCWDMMWVGWTLLTWVCWIGLLSFLKWGCGNFEYWVFDWMEIFWLDNQESSCGFVYLLKIL